MQTKFAWLLAATLAVGVGCGAPALHPLEPDQREPSAARADGAHEASAARSDPALSHRVDETLDRAIREHRVVGAVVLVMHEGRLVYHRAVGYADREARRPMTEDAVFRYASLTKTIVSLAALALVERGKLRLDDPVTRWLPEFRPKVASGEVPTITVHQLLTHTSGLGYRFLEPAGGPYHQADVSDGLDQPGLSFDENARRIVSVPLLAPPGTALHYSLSIDVLAEIVARASGSKVQQAVEALVTRPLGMSDTGFTVRDPSRLATPYADGQPAPQRMQDGLEVSLFGAAVRFAPSRVLDPNSYPSGGAGMVGTAADYVKLLEWLRTGQPGIVRAETLAMMRSNQVGALRAPEVGEGWGFGYGFAVLVEPSAAKTPMAMGAFRWGGAYGHAWFVDPKAGWTVVLLTNTAFEGMVGKLPQDLVSAVYGVGAP